MNSSKAVSCMLMLWLSIGLPTASGKPLVSTGGDEAPLVVKSPIAGVVIETQYPLLKSEFFSDGKLIITMNSKYIRLWDAEAASDEKWRFSVDEKIFEGAELSPNGKYVLVWGLRDLFCAGCGVGGNDGQFDMKRDAWILDAHTGRMINSFQVDLKLSSVRYMFFANQNENDLLIGVIGNFGRQSYYSTATGKQTTFDLPIDFYLLSDDMNTRLVVPSIYSGDDPIIQHRDKERKEVRVQKAISTSTVAPVLSKDGSLLVAESNDSSIMMIDTMSGVILHEIDHKGRAFKSMAISPNGKVLITADENSKIELWDTVTGQGIRSFVGQIGGISSIDIAPDGLTFLSSGTDGTARIWPITGSFDFLAASEEQASVAPPVRLSVNSGHALLFPVKSIAVSRSGKQQ